MNTYGSTDPGTGMVDAMKITRVGNTGIIAGRHEVGFDANYFGGGDTIPHAGPASQSFILAFDINDGSYLWSKSFVGTDENSIVTTPILHPGLNQLIYAIKFKGGLTLNAGTTLTNGTADFRSVMIYLSPTNGSLQQYFTWSDDFMFSVNDLLLRSDNSISLFGVSTDVNFDIDFEDTATIFSGSISSDPIHVRFNP